MHGNKGRDKREEWLEAGAETEGANQCRREKGKNHGRTKDHGGVEEPCEE